MIAATINFFDYEIFDLELSKVNNNSKLKIYDKTSSEAIIVNEDIESLLISISLYLMDILLFPIDI